MFCAVFVGTFFRQSRQLVRLYRRVYSRCLPFSLAHR